MVVPLSSRVLCRRCRQMAVVHQAQPTRYQTILSWFQVGRKCTNLQPSWYQPSSYKICAKLYHFATHLVSTWHQVDTNLLPAWYQLDTRFVPSWYQPGTQLVPTCYQVGAKLVSSWCQLGTELVPSCYQLVGTSSVPSWYQVGT